MPDIYTVCSVPQRQGRIGLLNVPFSRGVAFVLLLPLPEPSLSYPGRSPPIRPCTLSQSLFPASPYIRAQLQRIARGGAARQMLRIQEIRKREQAALWTVAVAVQRMWRGLKGRRRADQVRKNIYAAIPYFANASLCMSIVDPVPRPLRSRIRLLVNSMAQTADVAVVGQ